MNRGAPDALPAHRGVQCPPAHARRRGRARSRVQSWLVLGAVLLGAMPAARAQQQDEDLQRCEALGRRAPDLALDHCDKVLRLPALTDAQVAHVHVLRAVAWRTKGDAPHAIADLDEALRHEPGNAEALLMRSVALHHEHQEERALADAREALRLHPDASAWHMVGELQRSLGANDEALSSYTREIALAPDRPGGYHSRGLVRLHVGDSAGAITDFARSAGLAPTSAPARRDLGLARFIAGDFPGARDDFDAAIASAQSSSSSTGLQLLLWRYLAAVRAAPAAEEQARATLSTGAQAAHIDTWPRPVIDFFLGRTELAAVDQAATRASEQEKEARLAAMKLCEADFFVGERALALGRADESARALAAAGQTCPDETFHAYALRAERERAASAAPSTGAAPR